MIPQLRLENNGEGKHKITQVEVSKLWILCEQHAASNHLATFSYHLLSA